ncbi:MAG: Ig domain-containing protein, partial [Candidatus Thermoplasmatota archaeon]|nr:Ig domain-containing protein [Candidatus Thermoplasmatota archaeon]
YGFRHISYIDESNGALKYATDKSGSWVTSQTIQSAGDVLDSYTSISVDSNDAVHISYYDTADGNLLYATCATNCYYAYSWSKTIVDHIGDVGDYASMAIDSNDVLHISYYDATNTNLKYATCSSSCSSGSSWSKITIESSSGDVGKYNSIAIDSNDALHISYRDSTNDDLKYATCSSSCSSASSWTTSTIDSVGNVGSRTSIAIDSNDAVHISYHDITNGDLKYATDQSGSWANTTVDSVGTVGKYTSIAIDSNDVVHISYYDATTKDLKYASNMQSSIQTGVGNVIKFIDRVGEVGRYSSIAVDSNGDVHISYYDATNGDLKYAALQGVHPWNVYGYSISPALPAGLSLNFTSGEISGTPTAVSTNTTYTITARNTGGANTTTITIVVNDVAPSISYSNDDIVGTLNVSISPHSSPTNSGGAVTSWEISPDPGPAFHFNTVNGVISGTPGILLSKTQYTVYANNSGGSSIAYVNVTINPDAPNIAYSPDELNLTKYQSSSDLPLSPINTGGNTQTAALSCSSSDKLFVVADQQGTRHVLCGTTLRSVALNGTQTVSNNIVTGTAFGLEIDDDGHLHIGHWTYNYPYVYIHHATNKNGSWQSSNVFNFSYGGSVGYDSQGFSMAVGSDDSIHFTYIRVTSAGNTKNLYYLSNQSGSWSSVLLTNQNKPGEPSLTLNNDNVLHVAFSAGNSVRIGKYENGSYTTLLSRSNYLEPDIAIDAQGDVHVVYRTGSNGLYYSTNASGSWQHTTLDTTERHFDVRIALDSNDYPHVMTVSITGQFNNYRYVNHYSHDGSSWNGGNITSEMPLQQPRPDLFIDDDDVISMVYHDGSSANLFTGTGSTTYGYSISPALPSGLKFSQSTGTISGTATVQMNRTMFTITVQNSGGSSTAYINITVNDRMPSFTYSPENLTLTNNTVSSDLPLVPTIHYSADSPTDWVLMGTLPAGLNFGTNNGTIWGTATELWATTNYTVYGNNTGGSFNVSINITVTDQVPTLSFSPENLTLTRGQSSSDLPLAPTLSGPGEITSWSINATLPNGLFLGPNNGTLYGIATVNMTMTAYTIYANNSGGSASTQINITILEPIVILDYNPENLTLVRSDAMTTLHPTVTGGDAETWGIHPSIPAGLNFADGVLSGTPTVNLSTTMFTIYANTTGGSATHTINIT